MKDTPIVPLLIHKIKAAKISYEDGKAYTAIVLCSTDATTGKDMDLAIHIDQWPSVQTAGTKLMRKINPPLYGKKKPCASDTSNPSTTKRPNHTTSNAKSVES